MNARMTRYEIRDASGGLRAVHVRRDLPDGSKTFAWQQADGTSGLNETPTAALPLYRSERLADWPSDSTLIITEGEKAADALVAHGFHALGTVTGASTCPVHEPLFILRGRRVILWSDADKQGRKHMAQLAERLAGVAADVRVFEWADAPAKGDAADYLTGSDAAARLREELASARLWSPVPKTGPARPAEPRRGMQGTDLALDDVEPAAEAVDGPTLFRDLVATLTRYVVLPASATVAVALWIALTYLTGVVDVLPRLLLSSATKACGKTRLLALLAALVRRPLPASSITPSATFRAIEAGEPTLLLDEMDNSRLDENPELRAVLNSGHTRAGAWTVRSVGEQHEPRRFSTWAPVAMACIGKLPDTVTSRCVRIAMRRRSRSEPVERLRESRVRAELEALRAQLARWCQDHAEQIRDADPPAPEVLDDRAADNVSPLLAIADSIGADWPARALRAAHELCGTVEDDNAAIQLLADLRDLFDENGTDRVATADLLAALGGLEARPWPEWRDGKAITARGVARLLAPFGIQPNSVRFGHDIRKGYLRDCFEDAWSRYLPPYPKHPEQAASGAGGTSFARAEHASPVPIAGSVLDPHGHRRVPDVSNREGFGGAGAAPSLACPECGGLLLRWDFGDACTSCRRRWLVPTGDSPNTKDASEAGPNADSGGGATVAALEDAMTSDPRVEGILDSVFGRVAP